MRQIKLYVIAALLLFAQGSFAEVVLLKASQADGATEAELNQRRYERDMQSMNQVSDSISAQLAGKRDSSEVKSSANDKLQVRLIRVRH